MQNHIITITVPHKTISWNQLYTAERWRRSKLVQEERETMGHLLKRKIPKLTERIDIEISQFSKGPIVDSDNVCAKLWIDSLKDIQILKDDTPEYVRKVTTSSERAKENYTVLKIFSAPL